MSQNSIPGRFSENFGVYCSHIGQTVCNPGLRGVSVPPVCVGGAGGVAHGPFLTQNSNSGRFSANFGTHCSYVAVTVCKPGLKGVFVPPVCVGAAGGVAHGPF